MALSLKFNGEGLVGADNSDLFHPLSMLDVPTMRM